MMRHIGCQPSGVARLEVGGLWREGGLSLGPWTLHLNGSGGWDAEPGWQRSKLPRHDLRLTVALPGLVDHHVHVWSAAMLPLFGRWGVTTVRDVGSPAGLVEELARISRRHRLLPRVVLGGPMLDGPKPVWRESSEACSSAQDSVAAVRRAHDRGARWLKLYRRFPVELVERVVAQAHASDLLVTMHCAPGQARGAEAAGVDALEHVATLGWDLLGDQDAPPLEGTALVHATHRVWSQLDMDASIPAWAPRVPVTSTFSVHRGLLEAARGDWEAATADVPPSLVSFWKGLRVLQGWTAEQRALCSDALESMLHWSASALASGTRILPGTDAPNPLVIPGRSLWWEIDWFLRLGMPPLDAYLLATPSRSSLDVGQDAGDLAFVDLRRVERALADGHWGDEPVTAVFCNGCLFGGAST
jgi:hypothetical protein